MIESKVVSRNANVLDQVGACTLSLVVSFFVCSSSVAAQTAKTPVESKDAKTEIAPIADKWAVVVGVSKYSDKKISLPSGAKDAQKFAQFLTTKGNFAADHVKVMLDADATRENILKALGEDWLPRVAAANDLIVVYFRTGGSPSNLDSQGVHYLLAADSVLNQLFMSGIPLDFLPRMLRERTRAQHLVVIADADYSAPLLQDSKSLFRVNSRQPHVDTVYVSACGKEQRSCEDKTGGSIFTKRLLEALQLNGTDTKFASAFEHLAKNVQSDAQQSGTNQTPEMKSTCTGDLVLLAKPTAPRAVPQLESRADR
jgi:hypothetical protein